jgi:hypothetical protein
LTFKRHGVFLAGLLVVVLALVAAGCGGDDGGEAPEALPSSSCTAIEYEGDGDPITSSRRTSRSRGRPGRRPSRSSRRSATSSAADWKAGDYNIGFQSCDDATAQAGSGTRQVLSNANAYAPTTR